MLKSKKNIDSELSELYNELGDIKTQLNQAYLNFNYTLAPELIEACVYEINALQARYSYVIRRIKEKGDTNVERFRFPKVKFKEVST